MGLIRLEPAALKQAARDLDLAQARLDSVDRLIREIAPAIEYNWQSELTPEYLDYLEAVQQKACRIQRELEAVQRSLRNTAERAERAEREAQQAINTQA